MCFQIEKTLKPKQWTQQRKNHENGVTLIKIIIFRLLSNPSREWEKRLCNFLVIIVSLCVSTHRHACLSLNGQWKFSCFLMFCVSSLQQHELMIHIKSSEWMNVESIAQFISNTHDSIDVCKLIGTEYNVSIQISSKPKHRAVFARNIFRLAIVIRQIKVAKKVYPLTMSKHSHHPIWNCILFPRSERWKINYLNKIVFAEWTSVARHWLTREQTSMHARRFFLLFIWAGISACIHAHLSTLLLCQIFKSTSMTPFCSSNSIENSCLQTCRAENYIHDKTDKIRHDMTR